MPEEWWENHGIYGVIKHLDNLCKDMNGIGITGYIKDMEQEQNGDFYITGWKNDYMQLKHYRRIMEQTDPLVLCYKKTRFRSGSKFIETKAFPTTHYVPSYEKPRQTKKYFGICIMLLLIVVVFAELIVWLFRLF